MKDVSVFFTSAAFQWEALALYIDLLCCKFEYWKKLCLDNSCQFRPPKEVKKKFLCSKFRIPKVQYKEEWAVNVSRNWQAAGEKSHIIKFNPAGSVFKVFKILKKGRRIAQPLPKPLPYKVQNDKKNKYLFKYCIPWLIDFPTYVFGYPNT